MQADRRKEDFRMLDCAFANFFAFHYPVFVKRLRFAPSHMLSMHNHDYPQIWYCMDGNYMHIVEDRVYECGKGSVIVIPPGVFHKFWIPEGEMPDLLHLNVMYDIFLNTPPAMYVNAVANMFLPPFRKELGYDFPVYRMLSRESQAKLEDCTSWFASISFNISRAVPLTEIYEKLEELFSLPEFALPEAYHKKVSRLAQIRLNPMIRILDYLNLHYQEKVVEEDLLHISATCHANLYKYFKCFTGYTFPVYLQWLRVKRVFVYLTFTTYPISYISDNCGFSSQAHMTQVFNRFMRTTPREARIEQKKWLEQNPQNKVKMSGF